MKIKDPKKLRIVYMGTPDFAVAPLKTLVDNGYNVISVITMPDKPAGRGLKIQQSAVKQYALSVGLPILQPDKLKSEDFVTQFKSLNSDLGIVVAFRMLPEIIFAAPKLGTFNLHASLLPQYRGAAPINWAIINGEKHTGVTTFFLNQRMDEGAIIDARSIEITPKDNAGTLHDKLMKTGANLVKESVDLILQDDFKAKSQPEITSESLKPAPKLFKDTCHIDFTKHGDAIINLIHGLSPYPSAWVNMAEIQQPSGEIIKEVPIKILEAEFERSENSGIIGTTKITGNLMHISCFDGYIIPTVIQPAGKQRMATRDFLNGLKPQGDISFR